MSPTFKDKYVIKRVFIKSAIFSKYIQEFQDYINEFHRINKFYDEIEGVF